MCERAKGRMPVDNVYALAQQDVPQYWNVTKHSGQDALIVERFNWKIVDFEAVCHVPHALASIVRVCDDDNLRGGKCERQRLGSIADCD